MILILAGTMEARNLAGHLAHSGIKAIASLAGATHDPKPLPIETRVGGFGSDDGFAAFLENNGISGVIDATHPYATRITERAARICGTMNIPYLMLERPGWRSRNGDAWHEVATYDELCTLIPANARVFVATGRQSLAHYAHITDRHLICRVVDAPESEFPFPRGEWIVGRPPFSEEAERALFKDLQPDWIVVKNSGGASGRAKLDAARALGIPVAMIARPPVPPGVERREQILDALEWAEALA